MSLNNWLVMLSSMLVSQVGLAMETIIAAGVLVLIGLIIIMVVGALLFLLPAAIIAGVVWYLTANELYAGVAFLLVAIISLTRRK
ncbi:MAG: hypothetical protein ABSA11_15905 [Candidatus Bathyarchaeia archaeon]